MAMKVYKTDCGLFQMHEDAIRDIAAAGFEVIEAPCATAQDIIETCGDAAGLIVTVEPVTAEVMAALPGLKIVARCGVGLDTVDVPAATRLGIQVTNVPDANIVEVATHTMAMALGMNRRLRAFDAQVRGGGWASGVGNGMRRPSSQTFGIVGFGRIGQQVGRLAMAFGYRVIVSTPMASEQERAREMGIAPVAFDALIAESDIVSLHVPLLDSTRNIISREVLGRMKAGACLINVSRGGLVDETALSESLGSGHLAAAALDVFSIEPLPADSPLRDAPNLTLSPHAAFLSVDALHEVSHKVAGNVISVLRGAAPNYPVNTPRVAEPG